MGQDSDCSEGENEEEEDVGNEIVE